MKPEIFRFQNQEWVTQRRSALALSLDHARTGDSRVWVDIEASLVPPWVPEEIGEDGTGKADEHRTMSLMITGFLPALGHWRSLADAVMEHEPAQIEGAKIVRYGRSGPEVQLFSHGQGEGGCHDHLPEATSTRLVFGRFQRNEDGGEEVEYELEVFYRSQRGSREAANRFQNNLAEFMGVEPTHEIDEALLNEGRTLMHRGQAEFQQVRCMVPLNVADPIGYARSMAKKELGLTEFGWCRVNGGHHHDETFKPEDGICANGRLVILSMPSDYFYKWKAQQEKRKPRN